MNKFRTLVYLLLIVIGVGFFFACDDELANEKVSFTNQIQLLIPDVKKVTVYSQATELENYIDNCFVVAFNGSGQYKNSEKIEIENIVRNGNASVLLPMLNISIDAGDKVYAFCNIDTISLNISALSVESDVNTVFRPAKDYYFGGETLPMSGSIIWDLMNYNITMTRAVAKVTIQLGETFHVAIPDYIDDPAKWAYWDPTIFDESKVGFVIGNYGGASDILQNSSILSKRSAVLPVGVGDYYATSEEGRVIRLVQHAKGEREMTLYVGEYPSSTSTSHEDGKADNEWHAQRQHIIMMPNILEDITGECYQERTPFPDINDRAFLAWRLDFYDAKNKKYLDVKRNHHYTFVINKIGSLPYAYGDDYQNSVKDFWRWLNMTPGNVNYAIGNHGSNIEYDIYVEDDWANNTYSNGQYALSVSSDTIVDLDAPFRLKIQVPVEYGSSTPLGNTGPWSNNDYVQFFDRNGNRMGHTGSALEIKDDHLRTTTPGFGTNYPINQSGMTFYFNNPNIPLLENGAYMEIYYGNIYKRVPFKLRDMRLIIHNDLTRVVVAGGKTVAMVSGNNYSTTADIYSTSETALDNQFQAVLFGRNGQPMTSENVTWSLTGNQRPETTIDPSTGLLSVDLFEQGTGGELYVTARSVNFPALQETSVVKVISWKTAPNANDHGTMVWFAASHFIPNWGTSIKDVSGTWANVGTIKTAQRFTTTMTNRSLFGTVFSNFNSVSGRLDYAVIQPYNNIQVIDLWGCDFLGDLNIVPAWDPVNFYMQLYNGINYHFVPQNFQGLNVYDVKFGTGGYNDVTGEAYAFKLQASGGNFYRELLSGINEVIAFWPCFSMEMSTYNALVLSGRIPPP